MVCVLLWDLKLQGSDKLKLLVAVCPNYTESAAAVEEKQRQAKRRQIRREKTLVSSFEPLDPPL